jgi:hypothetical protein
MIWICDIQEGRGSRIMNKQNCWEFMRCGREPEGFHVKTMGVCPAAIFKPFNRVNGGSAAGRVCWAVDNTLCSGKSSGHFSKKLDKCGKCNFYKKVLEQEGNRILLTVDLLSIIESRVNSLSSGSSLKPYLQGEIGDP